MKTKRIKTAIAIILIVFGLLEFMFVSLGTTKPYTILEKMEMIGSIVMIISGYIILPSIDSIIKLDIVSKNCSYSDLERMLKQNYKTNLDIKGNCIGYYEESKLFPETLIPCYRYIISNIEANEFYKIIILKNPHWPVIWL